MTKEAFAVVVLAALLASVATLWARHSMKQTRRPQSFLVRLVSSCQRFDLKFDHLVNRMTRGTFKAEMQKPIGWRTWACFLGNNIAYVYIRLVNDETIPMNLFALVPMTLLFVSFALGIAALRRKDTNRIVAAILLIMLFGPIFLAVLAVVSPTMRDWLMLSGR